jgi:hypothetical protein
MVRPGSATEGKPIKGRGMPYAVYKTTGMEAVDRYYSEDLADHLAEAEGLLAGELQAAVEQFSSQEFIPPDEVTNYERGWPSSDTAANVIQHGYAQAVRLALDHEGGPVPIESFFIAGPGKDYEFHIHEGPERITVFTFVPQSRGYGSKRAVTKSWVVRVGDDSAIDGDIDRETLASEGEFPVLMMRTSGRFDDGPLD